MTYADYWRHPDKVQGKLLQHVNNEFSGLKDEVQSLLDRFKHFEGDLTQSELERLRRDIAKFEKMGYTANYEFRLQLQDLKRRSNISCDEAFDFLMFALFVGVYNNIKQDSIETNEGITREKSKDLVDDDIIIDILLWYDTVLPAGVTPNQMLRIETQYRAEQMASAVRANRVLDESFNDVNTPSIQVEFDRAKNALLKPSKGGGFHGILDKIMTSIIGYTVIAAAKLSDAKTYKFRAVVDERTTSICGYLNGKTFNVADMKLGWNVPPISFDMRTGLPVPHACRSWIVLDKPEKDLQNEDDIDIIKPRIIPKTSMPNNVIDTYSAKGEINNRTIYDKQGRMVKQINPNDHGHPIKHPFGEKGEHAHDIIWKDGEIADRITRALTKKERKEHRDIL